MSESQDGSTYGERANSPGSADKKTDDSTSSSVDIPSRKDNPTHAAVNRLKSLLSAFRGQQVPHTKLADPSSSAFQSGNQLEKSDSRSPQSEQMAHVSKPIQKIPLKDRSFLNPLLELTATSQGTTEDEIVRQSPDLFENVTIKQEKLDDLPSRSSTPSAKSDITSCAVVSHADDFGISATNSGRGRSASVPPTVLLGSVEDVVPASNSTDMSSANGEHGSVALQSDSAGKEQYTEGESVANVKLIDLLSDAISLEMKSAKCSEDGDVIKATSLSGIDMDKNNEKSSLTATENTDQVVESKALLEKQKDLGQKMDSVTDEDNSNLEEDDLQHLKSKYPLLWEAAHKDTIVTEATKSAEDTVAPVAPSDDSEKSSSEPHMNTSAGERKEVNMDDLAGSGSSSVSISNSGGPSHSKDTDSCIKVIGDSSSPHSHIRKLLASDDSGIATVTDVPDLSTGAVEKGKPLISDEVESVPSATKNQENLESKLGDTDEEISLEVALDEFLQEGNPKETMLPIAKDNSCSLGFTAEDQKNDEEGESGILNNSLSDSMMIKIADVKTVNVEDFEMVATAGESGSQKITDSLNASNVVTILGGDGDNKDVILQCRIKDGKFNCMSCGFMISFNTSFSLHIWRHLHRLSQTCPECFTAGVAKVDLNPSPFKITCPVVMSTMNELEKESCGFIDRSDDDEVVEEPASKSAAIKKGICILEDTCSSDEDCVIMAQGDMPKLKPEPQIDPSPEILLAALSAGSSNPFISLSSQFDELSEELVEQSPLQSATHESHDSTKTLVRSSSVSGHQLSEETIVINIMKLEKSKGFFTCGFSKCNFSTSIESNFGTHNTIHHSFESAFPCVYCGHTFYISDNLLIHMKGHHNASKMFQLYCCCFSKCRFCTNNSTSFKQHIEIMHPGENRYSCVFCKEEYNTDDELVQHLNENLLKLTQCPYCHVRSPSRQQVLQHIRRQHPKEGRRVMVTSKTICSDLKKSKSPEKLDTPSKHQCSACNYKTSNIGYLRKHLATCEKAKNFHETMAASSETSASKSTERQESNLSDLSSQSTADCGDEENDIFPIFGCSACGFSTTSNSKLLNHIKTNHGIYGSPGKKIPHSTSTPSLDESSQDSNNQQAMQDQTKATDTSSVGDGSDLKCPKCPHYFTRNLCSLKRHILQKHPGKTVATAMVCRHCMFLGQTRDSVLLHHSESHQDLRTTCAVDTIKLIFYGEKAACPICSFTCSFKIEPIVSHMIKKHAEDYSALKKALEQLPDEEDEPVNQGRTPEDKIICEYCGLKCSSLGRFLRHVPIHFSGQKQFTFYRCSCCLYHSDHRALVRAHTKQKHAGLVSPPEYIRYVMLNGTLGLLGEHSQDQLSSQQRSVTDETNVSNRPSTPSDADGNDMNEEQELHDDLMYPEDNSEEQYNEDMKSTESHRESFSFPQIKQEPSDHVQEAPPPNPNLLIERFHCDYCGFSTHIGDEFAAHVCDPNKALEMPQSHPSSFVASMESGDDSPLSEAGEHDDFSSKMCRKLLDDRWQCNECGFVAQHRSKIRRHCRYRHFSEKPFRCGYCAFSAVESGHVKRHCQSVHYNRPLSIVNTLKDVDGEFCLEDENELDQVPSDNMKPSPDVSDQIIRLGPYMFQCRICGYTQETCHLLERHVLCKHYKFHKYQCKYCPFTAAEKGKIMKHGKTAHDGKIGFTTRKFDTGEFASADNDPGWMESEDEPKTLLKEYVPTSLRSHPAGQKRKSSSKVDKDEPEEEKKAKVDESSDLRTLLLADLKVFYSKVYDSISYEPEVVKIFKCTECFYTTEARGNATRHVYFHHPDSVDFNLITEIEKPTGKKKAATCKICGHYAGSFTDMKKHVMGVHFKHSTYSCLYCPSRENAKKYMIKHLQNQHPEKPQEILDTPDPNPGCRTKVDEAYMPLNVNGKFKCMFCPFARTNKRQVEVHLRNIHFHVANPFRCSCCGFGAGRRDFLRSHHKTYHSNQDFVVMRVGVPGRNEAPSPSPASISQKTGQDRKLSSISSVTSPPLKGTASPLPRPSPVGAARKRSRQDSDSSSFSSTMMSPPLKRPVKSPVVKNESLCHSQSSNKGSPSVAARPQPGVGSPNPSSVSKPHGCPLCGNILHNRLRLITHLMVHLDYRPYICTYQSCNSRFIERSCLAKHNIKIHKKSLKLKYIPNAAMDKKLEELLGGPVRLTPTRPSSDSPHVETVQVKKEATYVPPSPASEDCEKPIKFTKDGETRFKCPKCTYTGAVISNCIKHMKRHGPKKFKCRYCSFCGFLPSEIKSHWLSRHKKNKKPYAFVTLPASISTSIKTEPTVESSENSQNTGYESDSITDAARKIDIDQNSLCKSKYSKINYVEGDLGEPIEHTRKKERGFLCPHCNYFTPSYHNCTRHMLRHGPKLIKCKFCDVTGFFPSEMSSHCMNVHGEFGVVDLKPEPGMSSNSKAATITPSTESRPKESNPKKKLGPVKAIKVGFSWQFKCPKCPFRMKSKAMVRSHMQSHHSGMTKEDNESDKASTFSSAVSGTESATNESASDHVEKESKANRPQKCKTVANILPPRVEMKNGKKMYFCVHCTYESTSSTNMNNHITRHGPKRFKCAYCSHTTFFTNSQHRHQKSCHKDKPVKYNKIDNSAQNAKNEKPKAVTSDLKNFLPVVKIKALKVDANGKPIVSPEKSNEPKKGFNMLPDSIANEFTRDGWIYFQCTKCSYYSHAMRHLRIHYRSQHISKVSESTEETGAGNDSVPVDGNFIYRCVRTFKRGGKPCGHTAPTYYEIRQHHKRTHREKKFRYEMIPKNEVKDTGASVGDDEREDEDRDIDRGNSDLMKPGVPPLPEAREVDGKMIFHCEKCPMTYVLTSKRSFRNHWESHFYGYECSVCGWLTLQHTSVVGHVKRYHKPSDNPDNYIVDHHPNRPKAGLAQISPGPSSTTASRESSVSRDAVPRESSLLKCSHCTYQCTSELDLALHVSLHTPNKRRSNERQTKSALWTPRPYECGYCHRGFFVRHKALSHCQTLHSDQPVNVIKVTDVVNNPNCRSSMRRSPVAQASAATLSETPAFESADANDSLLNSVKSDQANTNPVIGLEDKQNEQTSEHSDVESEEPQGSKNVGNQSDSELSKNNEDVCGKKNGTFGEKDTSHPGPGDASDSEISTDYDSFDDEVTAEGDISGDGVDLVNGASVAISKGIPSDGSGDSRIPPVKLSVACRKSEVLVEADEEQVEGMDCEEPVDDGVEEEGEDTMEGDVSSEEAWRLELQKNDREGKVSSETHESKCHKMEEGPSDISGSLCAAGDEKDMSLEGDVTDLDMCDAQNDAKQANAQSKVRFGDSCDADEEGSGTHAGDESFSSTSKQTSFNADSQDPSSWVVLDEVSNDGFPVDDDLP